MYHFGIHLEGGDVGVGAQAAQHGVGDVAYTRLQRQELGRDEAGFQLAYEEVAHVVSDLHGSFIGRGEGFHAVELVALDDTHNLLRVYFDDRGTDAVAGFVDGNLATVGRVERLVNVVHAPQLFGVVVVQFDDDFIGQCAEGRGSTHTVAQQNFAVGRYLGSFDDSYVYFTQKSVTEVLGQVREVHVEVGNLVCVDSRTGIFVRLVGRTASDSFCPGKGSVYVVAGRGTGIDTNLEGAPCRVFGFGPLGDGDRNYFGGTCCSKATKSYIIVVVNELSRFFGGNKIKCHIYDKFCCF